jgi:hypothetical protein
MGGITLVGEIICNPETKYKLPGLLQEYWRIRCCKYFMYTFSWICAWKFVMRRILLHFFVSLPLWVSIDAKCPAVWDCCWIVLCADQFWLWDSASLNLWEILQHFAILFGPGLSPTSYKWSETKIRKQGTLVWRNMKFLPIQKNIETRCFGACM